MSAVLADHTLTVFAEVVTDLENVRKAYENRIRAFTSSDQEGYGLPVFHPDVVAMNAALESLVKAEEQAVKNLQKAIKRHPLGPWVKKSTGVGEKQFGRLLACLADPYWNDLHDRPRTVSELWAYSGMHVKNGAAVHHARGQQSNWNEDARTRVWLIAQSCIKSKGHYRDVYDEGRRKYADAVHGQDCKRCGPKGKPALAGSPLSLGHQHARATRLICKEVLKDLWIESKRIHTVMEQPKGEVAA